MIRKSKAGTGAYGTVYNATLDDTEIAVKRNIIDSDISFSGSIKEMDLLTRLRSHPFIVKLLSVTLGDPFVCPNSPINNKYKEDYLHFIFEKGKKTLHEVIYEREIDIPFLKISMMQILIGVEYMHAKGVIHRDIKPSNLLWFEKNNKTYVKLCDFGLSKVYSKREPSSPHVVTCWYRAPEICSKEEDYSFSSDIWSVGCVFYEIFARKALLLGSVDNDIKILSKIIGLIPSPNSNDIFKIGNKVALTNEASPKYRKSWKTMIDFSEQDIEEFNEYPGPQTSCIYENFLDLLDKMLKLNPGQRLTATQALDHPFFKPFKHKIEYYRNQYPPVQKREPRIDILDCIERKWAVKLAFVVYNGKDEEFTWYKHRMLFQSIDLFDRYLVYISKKKKKKMPSDYNGQYLTKYETELKYIVCMYMSIKYFTTLAEPIPFEDLVTDVYKTDKAMVEAEEFEKKMLRDVLEWRVYRETMFEALDRLDYEVDEHQMRDMIQYYGELKTQHAVKPTELIKKFFNKTD